jgi:hypothetical protein
MQYLIWSDLTGVVSPSIWAASGTGTVAALLGWSLSAISGFSQRKGYDLANWETSKVHTASDRARA